MGNDICNCSNDTSTSKEREELLAEEAKVNNTKIITHNDHRQNTIQNESKKEERDEPSDTVQGHKPNKDTEYAKTETMTTNAGRDNYEMLNNIDQQFTNKCSGIDGCLSVKRMGAALNFYSRIICDSNNNKEYDLILSHCLSLETYLCEQYKNLMNDYGHIIYQHLDEKNSDNQYQQIYDYLIKEYSLKCDVSKCSKYGRNCRNMQKQRITIKDDESNDEEKLEDNYHRFSAYTDMLDTIHCNLLHSYDIGYRINKSELDIVSDNKNNEQKNNGSDLNVNTDEYINKISKAVASKRKSLTTVYQDRIKNNKFLTTTVQKMELLFIDDMFKELRSKSIDQSVLMELKVYLKEQEYDTDAIINEIDMFANDKNCNLRNFKCNDDESKANCMYHVRLLVVNKRKKKYSFGEEFYYWPQFKDEAGFVEPKYSTFKQEIYQHDAFEIFHNLYRKVKIFYAENNEHIREKIGSKQTWMRSYYDIERDVPASMEHFLALKLYTDATELSAEFSRSFRKLGNELFCDVKERNKSFAHWSRLLREMVEVFGEDAFPHHGTSYYHGTSYLIFDAVSARFCAPTSTTRQLEVALNFISEENGIILELNCGAYVDCMIFNAAFLSCFGNEDERLLFCGRREWKFVSIRLCTNDGWENYMDIFTAFRAYCAVLQGVDPGKINNRSINILKSLISSMMDNNVVEMSPYIKNTLITWFGSITKINVNFHYFPFHNEYYTNFFISNYSGKDEKQSLSLFNILTAKKGLWPNVRTISYCKWDHTGAATPIDVDLKYLLALHADICSVKNHQSILKGMVIGIQYANVNMSDAEYQELVEVFNPFKLYYVEAMSQRISAEPGYIVYETIAIQC